jgi:hypothetical protein
MLAFLPGILHQLGTSRSHGGQRRPLRHEPEGINERCWIDSVPATYEDVRDRAYREGVG